jgi:uncharacterized membrane protein YeaQ/YmgE (transglycosylase-associated protein family)
VGLKGFTTRRKRCFTSFGKGLIGLIVGALAKFVMPGTDLGGILVTMLIGIAGSLVAGFLGRTIGWY